MVKFLITQNLKGVLGTWLTPGMMILVSLSFLLLLLILLLLFPALNITQGIIKYMHEGLYTHYKILNLKRLLLLFSVTVYANVCLITTVTLAVLPTCVHNNNNNIIC